MSFSSAVEEATMGSGSIAKRCGVVTGANKGIGLEICRQLASNGIMVILTARDERRGIEAVNNLKAAGLSDVVFHQLDVKDPASIASLAKFIETHFRKLDILVNNAGDGGLILDCEAFQAFKLRGGVVNDENVNLLKRIMKQTYEKAEDCIRTNYYGTQGVTQSLLPLLQLSQSARIVNVSSLHGQLKNISNNRVKAELDNVEELTEEKLDKILQRFLRDFKEDKLEANGWPVNASAYKVSKAAVNAYTRIIARKFAHFLVNCVHPGLVKTDITCNTGEMTAEEGARAPVKLALLPDGGPSGLYFHEMDVGRVLLNALLYPSIKTNLQKNSLVAIFHTSGEISGNDGGNNDSVVVARTYLIRTKSEEDRNKLATAIQEYAPSS